MATAGISRAWGTILITVTILFLSFPAYAKYRGGTGEPNDPYQIATAEDLMLLGESPEDYDKHFILTADIDLDPNLPGRKVFDTAVIVGSMSDQGISFTGTFDGNGHEVSHLTIVGSRDLGLFGELESGGKILDVGVTNVNVNGSSTGIGGLVGFIRYGSSVINCHSTGTIIGDYRVGGLVGHNDGDVLHCYSSGTVSGDSTVGGLVGNNNYGRIATSFSTSIVHGDRSVGGLVGWNENGSITTSYSTGTVHGDRSVGGLVGANGCNIAACHSSSGVTGRNWVGGLVGIMGTTSSSVSDCYSTGPVSGIDSVGGLVGRTYGSVTGSFWDMETSGQATSAGGVGKTTTEMQQASTFLEAGWDFVDETENGTEDIWWILEGQSYPRLWWQYGRAFSPYPQDGVADVAQPVVLSWLPGASSVSHDVYFGEDEQAVANGTTESLGIYRGRQPPEMTIYDPGSLEFEKTYYWRIDEVDEADPNSPWKGGVWCFTTADFFIVDDFESYNNDYPGHEIWNTWRDGYVDPNNGLQIGYLIPPLMRPPVHGGVQSMLLCYSNTAGAAYSKTTRTFVVPQDWTKYGIQTLGLWFYGIAGNTGQLYVKINGIKVLYDGDASNLAIPAWQPWNIDLATSSANLASVTTLAIGVDGNGASGTLCVDDIRLYRPTPQEPGS